MTDKTPEDLANDKLEDFDFAAFLESDQRSYPEDEVVVYFDEKTGYELKRLLEEYATETDQEKVKLYDAQIEKLREKLAKSKVTLHFQGISEGRRQELLDLAFEQYPGEDEIGPLGVKTGNFVQNDKRDELFTNLLLADLITWIESPFGSRDSNITPEKIAAFEKKAPVAALARVNAMAEKMRMAVEWFEYAADEDFLQNS